MLSGFRILRRLVGLEVQRIAVESPSKRVACKRVIVGFHTGDRRDM